MKNLKFILLALILSVAACDIQDITSVMPATDCVAIIYSTPAGGELCHYPYQPFAARFEYRNLTPDCLPTNEGDWWTKLYASTNDTNWLLYGETPTIPKTGNYWIVDPTVLIDYVWKLDLPATVFFKTISTFTDQWGGETEFETNELPFTIYDCTPLNPVVNTSIQIQTGAFSEDGTHFKTTFLFKP